MTIAADYTPLLSACNGVTTDFVLSWPFYGDDSILVALVDATTGVPLAPAPVLNGTGANDYTIISTPDADTGISPNGTVRFNVAPSSSYQAWRGRETDDTQGKSFATNGRFPAKQTEGALDVRTLNSQERVRDPSPPDRAGKVAAWGDLADGAAPEASTRTLDEIETVVTSYLAGAGAIITIARVDTIADLRLLLAGAYQQVFSRYYYAGGDQSIGEWFWDGASMLADDGVITIKPALVSGGSPGRWRRGISGSRVFEADWGPVKAWDTSFDSSPGIAAVITALGGRGRVILPRGTPMLKTQLVLPNGVILEGHGRTSDRTTPSQRGATTLLQGIDIAGDAGIVKLAGNDSGLRDLHIENTIRTGSTYYTGHGVHVTGYRAILDHVSVAYAGSDCFRIGLNEAGASTVNANGGLATDCIALKAGRRGFNLDQTNTDTSPTFPQGNPDCNAWVFIKPEASECVVDGFWLGNTIDNTFIETFSHDNGANNLHLYCPAASLGPRDNTFHSSYFEHAGGGAHDVLCDAGAKFNLVNRNRAGFGPPDWVDNDGDNSFTWTETDIPGGVVYSRQITVANTAGGGTPTVNFIAGAGVKNVSSIGVSVEGTSGGKMVVSTAVDGGALTPALVLHDNQRIAIPSANGLTVGKDVVDTTTAGTTINNSPGRIDHVLNGTTAKTTQEAFYNSNGQVGTIESDGTHIRFNGTVKYPTASTGLASGDWWDNAGTLTKVP